MSIGQRLRCAIATREIPYKIATGGIIFKTILIIIEYLQRVNERVNGRLLDAHERTEIHMLVKKIRLWNWIDCCCFDGAYKLWVARKRRRILEDINIIDNERLEWLHRRQRGEAPCEAYPAEKIMEKAVLETYYVYLSDDDAYKQKAFLEFLKKKVEDGDDRQEISAYLEQKCKHESYDEYKRFTFWDGGQLVLDRFWAYDTLVLDLPELWIEFFQSDNGYADIIPDERPKVDYQHTNSAYIPRFIFEKPYVEEFSEQEFREKFIKEWDVTHGEPDDDQARRKLQAITEGRAGIGQDALQGRVYGSV